MPKSSFHHPFSWPNSTSAEPRPTRREAGNGVNDNGNLGGNPSEWRAGVPARFGLPRWDGWGLRRRSFLCQRWGESPREPASLVGRGSRRAELGIGAATFLSPQARAWATRMSPLRECLGRAYPRAGGPSFQFQDSSFKFARAGHALKLETEHLQLAFGSSGASPHQSCVRRRCGGATGDV